MKTASLVANSKGEKRIKISFPYDTEEILKIRDIPGRTYHKENHCWSAPLFVDTVNTLKDWNYSLCDKLQVFIQKVDEKTLAIQKIGIPGLKGTLYPFQNEGVIFLENHKGRALIADEMGLGKTIQALAYAQLHPELTPIIIVCPASLKLNWAKECKQWMEDPQIEILSGTKIHKTTKDIIIINYDILFAWVGQLRKIDAKIIILDEAHYTKTSNAKRTKATKMLAKTIPHIIALSGTPIVNKPIEIYNAVKMIDPELFPNRWHYYKYYCNAKHNGFGWDFNGASHTSELHDKLKKSLMIRRLKKDVLPDLPAKIRSFVPIEISNKYDYKEAETDFIKWIEKEKGLEAAEKAKNAEAFSKIENLKQLAVKGKMKQCINWIEDFLTSDQKLVVFATHKFVIEKLMETFPDIAVKIDGSVSSENRQKAVDDFQNKEEIKLFIGNIQAAGVGITLTASSNVVFIEFPWSPGLLNQAGDRCHRIGQKDAVNIYYLYAINTIDEKVIKMLHKKSITVDQVLNGEESDDTTTFQELINSFKNEN